MYNQYLKVRDAGVKGIGVFTEVRIPADVPILEFKGDIFSNDELINLPHPENALQIGLDMYLGNSGDVPDFINHSCDPNCSLHIVGKRAVLYSLFVIPPDAELSFDYSTSSTDTLSMWKMNCNCGSHNCRGVISGFQYLDENLKKEYKKSGMLPLFMTHNIFMKK